MSKKSAVAEVDSAENAPVDVEVKRNKAKKLTVVITYIFALLCLLAGLLVPLYGWGSHENLMDGMMIRYIPSMINNIIVQPIVPDLPWFISVPFKGAFDFISLVSVLYALLCVVALIMLIPVCAGKRTKRTSANCALVVEILALVVLLSYIAYDAYFLVATSTVAWTDYNILIAFGGTLIVAIIQSIATKGSIGVSKTIAVILSALAVISLVDITLFATFLKGPLNSLSSLLQSGDTANFLGGLFEGVGSDMGLFGITSLFAVKETLALLNGDALLIVVYIIWMLVAVFTVVNMVIDIIGLGTGKKFKTGKVPCKNGASNTFALVRYVLTFVLTVALIVFAIIIKGLTSGVYLYFLAVILLIEVINAIARTVAANKRCKKYAKSVAAAPAETTEPALPEPAFAAETAEPEPVYVEQPYIVPQYEEPAYEEPVAEEVEEPVEEEPVVSEEPLDYTQPIDYTPIPEEPAEAPEPTVIHEPVYFYAGDTDEFMETLTDAEKIEFAEVFIKRNKGTVNGVPAYAVGGDNDDFFPAVFVHVNRFRNIVSDSLMTKMYKQLGKVM